MLDTSVVGVHRRLRDCQRLALMLFETEKK
jgi:hypothetical protein